MTDGGLAERVLAGLLKWQGRGAPDLLHAVSGQRFCSVASAQREANST